MTRREALRLLGMAGLSVAGCATRDDEAPASQEGAFSSKCTNEQLAAASGTCPPELRRYEKIVVLMMENRSFDHYFGHLTLPRELGGQGMARWDGKSRDAEGKQIDGYAGTESQLVLRPEGRQELKLFHAQTSKLKDITHSWDGAHEQFNNGAMDGFVQAHFADMQDEDAACGRKCAGLGDPLAFYKRPDTPVLHQLFDNYALCDRWFSSVMGPTWPNRHYLHAGTSMGIKDNSRMSVDSNPNDPGETRNIWHELKKRCIPAANYSMDVAWVLGGFGLFNSVPQRSVFRRPDNNGPRDNTPGGNGPESFEEACENGTLPNVSVIDPAFIFSPCDDHPPHDIKAGQAFISSIYKMLTKNQEQWAKTLFIITYDEAGGFYDHVAPPKVDSDERADFKQLGFRVPSLVIGPFVKKNYVSHVQYDHVSFLSTVTRRFGLTPLNNRVATTNDIRDCIDMNMVETRGAPPSPVLIQSVQMSEALVHESIRDSLGQSELAEVVYGRPATLEQKYRATNDMLEAFDRIGVARIGR